MTRWKRMVAILLAAAMTCSNNVNVLADEIHPAVQEADYAAEEENTSMEEISMAEIPMPDITSAVDGTAVEEAVGTESKLTVVGVDEEAVEGVDYEFKTGTYNSVSICKLIILSDKKMEIRGDGNTSATDAIVFGASGRTNDIHVVLSEVKLNNYTAKFTPAQICDNYQGDVYLTLQYENYLKAGGNHAALQKNGTTTTGTLTIDGEGTLEAYGAAERGAGIGGTYHQEGCNIVINSGTITATGGKYCAGIGGGYGASGNNITINNGTIKATGGDNAAGIGGGLNEEGNHITINGGTITAIGGYSGAGIGGSYLGGANDIAIHGGTVYAKVNKGTAIGAGTSAEAHGITIDGGTITAENTYSGEAGIGGLSADQIYLGDASIKCITKNADFILGTPLCSRDNPVSVNLVKLPHGGNRLVEYRLSGTETYNHQVSVPSLHENDGYLYLYLPNGMYDFKIGEEVYGNVVLDGRKETEINHNTVPADCKIKLDNYRMQSLLLCDDYYTDGVNIFDISGLSDDYELVQDTKAQIPVRITVSTNRTVILNGITVTGDNQDCPGIKVSDDREANFLLKDGSLNSLYGGDYYAGIDTGKGVVINGTGTLTVYGGEYSAGIGASYRSISTTVSNIAINGGTIKAYGERYAAGIGGSYGTKLVENITINGGDILVNGGYRASCIGGGENTSMVRNIHITGGAVTAKADTAAAIGGMKDVDGITIDGGTITATGGHGNPGIGGNRVEGIRIKNAIVNVTSGTDSVAIGSVKGACKDVVIQNATVTIRVSSTYGQGAHDCGIGCSRKVSVSEAVIENVVIEDSSVKTVLPQYTNTTPVGCGRNLKIDPVASDGSDVSVNEIAIPHNNSSVVEYRLSSEDHFHSMTLPGYHDGDDFYHIFLPGGTYDIRTGDKLYEDVSVPEQTLLYTETEVENKTIHVDHLNGRTLQLFKMEYYIGSEKYTVKNTSGNYNAPYQLCQSTQDTVIGKIEIAEAMTVKLDGIKISSAGAQNAGPALCTNIPSSSGSAKNREIVLYSMKDSINKFTSTNGYAGISNSLGYYDTRLYFEGEGTIISQGGGSAAGIGGDSNSSANEMTVRSGTIRTYGGTYGAGMGCGYGDSRFTADIYINGGDITAVGGYRGAGIGGSYKCSAFELYFGGGKVQAIGGDYGAGIGGGGEASASQLYFRGGIIQATGGKYGAGIGGGSNGSMINSYTEMIGGTITAIGGYGGAGIGGGSNGTARWGVTIQNASVKSVGGENANDIGGGRYQSAAAIRDKTQAVSANLIRIPHNGSDSVSYRTSGSEEEYTTLTFPAKHEKDGFYYLYLPEGTYDFLVGDQEYAGCQVTLGESATVYNAVEETTNDIVVDLAEDDRIDIYHSYYIIGNEKHLFAISDGSCRLIQENSSPLDKQVVIHEGIRCSLQNLRLKGRETNDSSPLIVDTTEDVTLFSEENTENSFEAVEDAAGIHKVQVSGNLILDGRGSIFASASNGAGIGGTPGMDCENIQIVGGTVRAESLYAAGIGGGYSGAGENISITGGTVTATSQTGMGIGGGDDTYSGSVFVQNASVKTQGDERYQDEVTYQTTNGVSANLVCIPHQGSKTVSYRVSDSGDAYQNVTFPSFHENDAYFYLYLPEGLYDFKVGEAEYLKVRVGTGTTMVYSDGGEGSRTLILDELPEGDIHLYRDYYMIGDKQYHLDESEESYHLTQKTSCSVNRSVTIQDGGTYYLEGIYLDPSKDRKAALVVDCTEDITLYTEAASRNLFYSSMEHAGIEKVQSDGKLILDGTGTIQAVGGQYGAGIGGAHCKSGENIVIQNGTIYAGSAGLEPPKDGYNENPGYGAGIGSGQWGDNSSITIRGGVIYAYSIGGNAVGGGDRESLLTIEGGTVFAYGGAYSLGSRGGSLNLSAKDQIYIRGGSVYVVDSRQIADIPRYTPGKTQHQVYCQTVATGLANQNVTLGTISGAEYYNASDLMTDDLGNVYLWLPKSVTANMKTEEIAGDIKVIVRFLPGNGTAAFSQNVKIGEKLVKPAEPERAGYTFKGWFTEPDTMEENRKWDFGNHIVESSMTLYAYWEKDTENSESGNEVEKVLVHGSVSVSNILDSIYTGSAVYPEVAVYDGNILLQEGRDYTLKFKNNMNAAGAEDRKAPCVTVKGKGYYQGSVTKKFTILPAELSVLVSENSLETEYEDAYFAGTKELAPAVKLNFHAKKLKAKKDYVVSFVREGSADTLKSIKDAGSYLAVVEGCGNFTGKLCLPVTLVDPSSAKLMKQQKVTVKNAKREATGSAVEAVTVSSEEALKALLQKEKKSFAVLIKDARTKKGMTAGEDYTVTYRNHVNAGTATMILTGNAANGYVGSKTVKFTLTGKQLRKLPGFAITESGEPMRSSCTYDGRAKTLSAPEISYVSENGEKKVLQENTDYTISYQNNVKAGKATVIVTGKGIYAGTIKRTFQILASDISQAGKTGSDWSITLENHGTVSYCAGGVKPQAVVYYRGRLLEEGTDYKVSFRNNNKVTENGAKIIFIGCGSYCGRLEQSFSIVPKDLSDEEIVAAAGNLFYQGTRKDDFQYKPKLVLYDHGTAMKEGTDYTVSFNGNCQAELREATKEGTRSAQIEAVITAVAGSGYTGVPRTEQITVASIDIGKAKVSMVKNRPVAYTGDLITLSGDNLLVTVKQGKTTRTLVYGEDYEIAALKKSWFPGIGSAVLRGRGESCGGTRKFVFKIAKKKIQM